MSSDSGWWDSITGYQVYLPSFADSDGDGWGDLRGVAGHLDHLVRLGVDALWLTPFHPSPMRDGGYDITDHLRVDERYGGDAALEELLTAAHARGLRVLGDLVVNHTSREHPWFLDARTSTASPFRDFYIWQEPAPGDRPPNNWLSHFGGPAWTPTPETGQSYLHLFSPDQPDLNWSSPRVAAAVDQILEHWLARGLDGFRIDTAGYLAKDPLLRDNPARPAGRPLEVTGATLEWRLQEHLHDIHRPEAMHIHRRWRRIADRHDALLLGEIYDLDPVGLAAYSRPGALHAAFWFGVVESGWHPERLATLLRQAADSSAAHAWTLGNHDRPRAASRFATSLDRPRETDRQPGIGARRALAVQSALALLPGQLWIYQGDELGLPDAVPPGPDLFDPLDGNGPGRAASRAPVPWIPGPGNGFTSGTAWLPWAEQPAPVTVEAQDADRASVLNRTRALLATRRSVRSLVAGHHAVASSPTPSSLRIERGPVGVLVNFGDDPVDGLESLQVRWFRRR